MSIFLPKHKIRPEDVHLTTCDRQVAQRRVPTGFGVLTGCGSVRIRHRPVPSNRQPTSGRRRIYPGRADPGGPTAGRWRSPSPRAAPVVDVMGAFGSAWPGYTNPTFMEGAMRRLRLPYHRYRYTSGRFEIPKVAGSSSGSGTRPVRTGAGGASAPPTGTPTGSPPPPTWCSTSTCRNGCRGRFGKTSFRPS